MGSESLRFVHAKFIYKINDFECCRCCVCLFRACFLTMRIRRAFLILTTEHLVRDSTPPVGAEHYHVAAEAEVWLSEPVLDRETTVEADLVGAVVQNVDAIERNAA